MILPEETTAISTQNAPCCGVVGWINNNRLKSGLIAIGLAGTVWAFATETGRKTIGLQKEIKSAPTRRSTSRRRRKSLK